MDDQLAGNLAHYTDASRQRCIDPVVYHELSHTVWGENHASWFFWMPLPEGLAAWLELHPPARPELVPLFDAILLEGKLVEFTLPEGDGAIPYTFFAAHIEPAGTIILEVGRTHQVGVTRSNTVALEAETAVPFPFGDIPYFVVADPPALTTPEAGARVRLVRLHLNGSQQSVLRLACRPESYQLQAGLWLEGNCYRIPNIDTDVGRGHCNVTQYATDRFGCDPAKPCCKRRVPLPGSANQCGSDLLGVYDATAC